ncbi:MAG: glycosyltransferase [Candidatus Paceibacteria bacterium]
MDTNDTYLHIGRAADLSGRDRTLYRALETVPAVLSVGTLLLFVLLSFTVPAIVAYFTIGFSAFWFFKTVFFSIHLRHNFKRMRHHLATDWSARLANVHAEDITHVVIFPFYIEPYEVLKESVQALKESRFDMKRIAVVLAAEERAGEPAQETARRLEKEYAGVFMDIITTVHPDGLPDEIPGKGANIAHAAREATRRIVDRRKLPHEKVLVSAFDSDTVVYPDYFACLTWYFLTAEQPLRSSFQPVPLYNNNIWDSPTLSRILAYASTFWQMIQQERPERLSTFSSHAIPLSALVEAGYWQRNMVNEDSRIFFNLFMHYDGDYRVVPISYPVSMDANVGRGFFSTVSRLYKQHLRWMYGSSENIPYLVFHFLKNPRIPAGKKLQMLFVHIEGTWSLAVQPLFLFAVGWLPLLIGGAAFNDTVLSYNLPIVSSWFLTVAMFGLVFLAVYSIRLVPKRPEDKSRFMSVRMLLQWLLVPFTMVAFSSLPGLEGQLRLAFGRYIGFWSTPKSRVQATRR